MAGETGAKKKENLGILIRLLPVFGFCALVVAFVLLLSGNVQWYGISLNISVTFWIAAYMVKE